MQNRLAWMSAVVIGLLASSGGARAEEFEVEVVKDVAFYDGADADPIKHKLDLYLPKGKKDFPVLFFVHGGAWVMGDKNQLGIYSALGRNFAKQGIGTVVTNYRLSPKVQHPEHIKDVAKAFAWTHHNIAKHGGKPDQIFACGHSAGGHLVALLGTDESYLKNEGLSLKAIKGVIPMSGVYRIPEKMMPTVFGKDPEIVKKASPLEHVRAGLPPFCIIYGDKDMPQCDKMSELFCKSLKEKECTAETCSIADRSHVSLIMLVSRTTDPASEAIVKFIEKNSK